MNTLIKYRIVLYLAIPLFLILSLYGQLQSVKVRDVHDALADKLPIEGSSRGVSGINALVVMIPAIGPYLEINSVTTLFKDMKSLTEDYSEENSSKIFRQMEQEYSKEVGTAGGSLYLYNYNSTVRSMLTYLENYSVLGPDSQVVKDSKLSLSKNLRLLQMISMFKILCYVILFILGVIGVFVFKGRYSEKGNTK